ncbi:MAG: type IV pilus biogenesis/stability protein PilW [Candidatus Thiodiazotropha sp. (ex Epidulcina cf. delphinae)]|nr:type IV pilus biogenesis/stability protein PilW [Candidatus Thiodiazotropha sp. (ex Epidulcina cf. delphinae)]
MNSIAGYRRFSALLLSLFLIGCASQEKMTDATGNLGREKRTSPAKIYVEMGMAYMRDGQSAVALQKLKKAVAVDDDFSEAHNVIAILYEQLGESDLAGVHYDRAVALDGHDPYIRNARGSYYCRQGRYEAATQEFQQALANPLYPTPWVALTNAGLCIERAGKKAEAESFYRRALTANPQYPTALFQMAELVLQQQQDLSARAYLERYHSEAQPSAASLWLGVQIERRLGDRDKAAEYRGRLLKEFPDAPEVQTLYESEK